MAAIDDLINKISDKDLRARIAAEISKMQKGKKFGLVFENHLPECTPLYNVPVTPGKTVAPKKSSLSDAYKVLSVENGIADCIKQDAGERVNFLVKDLVVVATFGEPIYPYLQPVDSVCNAPGSDLWHTLIEADNYHALQLLDYLYHGKVDCIYIDPPYNTGAKDWKYNNNYVDASDAYRHSKWLSFMEKRLALAKKLLNPKDSVLIVTIDEKEYLYLGCLLEEMFPEARIQMISSAINSKGVARNSEFFRVNEYIFIIRLGLCDVKALPLPDEWSGNIKTSTTKTVRWGSLMRSGSGSLRKDSPGCFYPIFISGDKKHFIGAGLPLAKDVDKNSIVVPEGQIAIFPIHADGTEGRWQYSRDKFLSIQQKGYVRISLQTNRGITLRYISEGWQKKVESGQIVTIGKNEDGSLILNDDNYIKEFIPCNQWWIPTHNATEFGSKLIQNIIGSRFSFPKSLYSVHDAIRFFVANKPRALIVDFFAGSGTTLHAVNLLNAEDGGRRRCIMVTNNEVSVDEAKSLTQKGYRPGDAEWENLGIARYVTWPRTKCSIKGVDINGNPLKGAYIGSGKPMADGFAANCAFFKLGFLDKTAVSLGRQFKELLPLLWLKSGAVGSCPKLEHSEVPDMLVLPQNRFAVLINENCFADFQEQLEAHTEINYVYIVTNYEDGYRAKINELNVEHTFQLYRDYLDNFSINYRRS
ncbi:DNA methyltransferase [uncultured Phascolarctobacterium sp.]|uniref:site-specific DNA-methyltransferase n=1 Tax=uncultured Phascolarctobacterium sp. TaxID=512296 RepID=UPI0025E3D8F6|nr:DNA methyltransferase [uncultured Phascolarctobacterium sp.]